MSGSDFAFKPNPPIPMTENYPVGPPSPPAPPSPPPQPSPPSPLSPLFGTWQGKGFNTIWRPHFPAAAQDRFLELNLTSETLTFCQINGAIPNRGLLQADINMFGLTYLQQIADASNGSALHIEPGIWIVVPETTNPAEPPTVVRMASIPHGTAILTQGTASNQTGPPAIPDNNIIPFSIDTTPPLGSEFPAAMTTFTEMNLAVPSTFRAAPSTISQAMVQNPNSILRAALANRTVRSTTTLSVSTTDEPVPGGGTANTAFLGGGNATASLVTATFWIETVESPPGPDILQLQYSQTVMLDFNGLHWPHVTIATLTKVSPG
ncbi:MAG: heme-binding protein [Candidatus Dormibacteria bacterium]